MRYKILVLLTFVFFGCDSETKQIPELLSKNEMVSVLIEIHLLESKIEKLHISKDSSLLLFNTFEREIFKELSINKEYYVKSYQYYLEEVSEMEKIYTIVVDSLNFRQKTFESLVEKEKKEKAERRKKKRDSLKVRRGRYKLAISKKDSIKKTVE